MYENKMEIIAATESLFNMTSRFNGDLRIEPGVYKDGKFERVEDNPKHVLIRYKDQDPQFGYIQSIEGDSGLGILYDVFKAVKTFE